MLKKSPRQSVEDTCVNLREVKESLQSAATVIENEVTKKRIQNQIHTIENSLHECEEIVAILREH